MTLRARSMLFLYVPLALLVAFMVSLAWAITGVTERVIQFKSFPDMSFAYASGGGPSVSSDGHVAYWSELHTIDVVDEPRDWANVYIYDYPSGTTERVSVRNDGTTPEAVHQLFAVISDDSRMVVFQSRADDLVAGDNNGIEDIFLRDLENSSTMRITPTPSVIPDPPPSSGRKHRPYRGLGISADGNELVFESKWDHLSVDDSNGDWDVYLYDVVADEFKLISADPTGQAGGSDLNGDSAPSISADGNWVVFTSESPGLVPGFGNGGPQVYIRDHVNGTTEPVSVTLGGSATTQSWGGSTNFDGSLVVFNSEDTNLVTENVFGKEQVYLRDRTTNTTELVSQNAQNEPANDHSYILFGGWSDGRAISDDGRFVIFNSWATNLVSAATTRDAAFVRDRVLETTRIVSIATDGTAYRAGEVSISGNGRYVAFSSFFDITGDHSGCCDFYKIYIHDLGPTDPAERIDELIDQIVNLNLQEGISNSLDAKLDSALDALADLNENNDVSACNSLAALISAVNAQTGGKIDPADAEEIITRTQEVRAELGCI